jgi:hypothetical protein
MSGMSDHRKLYDFVLGYDDDYKSNETLRGVYYYHFGSHPARPDLMLHLQYSKPQMRPPAVEGEAIVVSIVKSALSKMRHPPQQKEKK